MKLIHRGQYFSFTLQDNLQYRLVIRRIKDVKIYTIPKNLSQGIETEHSIFIVISGRDITLHHRLLHLRELQRITILNAILSFSPSFRKPRQLIGLIYPYQNAKYLRLRSREHVTNYRQLSQVQWPTLFSFFSLFLPFPINLPIPKCSSRGKKKKRAIPRNA